MPQEHSANASRGSMCDYVFPATVKQLMRDTPGNTLTLEHWKQIWRGTKGNLLPKQRINVVRLARNTRKGIHFLFPSPSSCPPFQHPAQAIFILPNLQACYGPASRGCGLRGWEAKSKPLTFNA